jgi:hypothetical protein
MNAHPNQEGEGDGEGEGGGAGGETGETDIDRGGAVARPWQAMSTRRRSVLLLT